MLLAALVTAAAAMWWRQAGSQPVTEAVAEQGHVASPCEFEPRIGRRGKDDTEDMRLCGDPWRVKWKNAPDDATAVRIHLTYYADVTYVFHVAPNASEYVFPPDAARREYPKRKDFGIEVTALTPSGEVVLGTISATVE